MTEQEINPVQQISRVVLSGRLVGDPELRELPDRTPVCLLRLASAVKRRSPGASRQGVGEFSVLVLGPTARRIAPYLYRGRRVVVQGRLETERWEAGEGPEREVTCVLAERVHLAGDAPPSAQARAGAQARALDSRSRARDPALGVSLAAGFSDDMWCL
jgi:single stranded DNA-binding protein